MGGEGMGFGGRRRDWKGDCEEETGGRHETAARPDAEPMPTTLAKPRRQPISDARRPTAATRPAVATQHLPATRKRSPLEALCDRHQPQRRRRAPEIPRRSLRDRRRLAQEEDDALKARPEQRDGEADEEADKGGALQDDAQEGVVALGGGRACVCMEGGGYVTVLGSVEDDAGCLSSKAQSTSSVCRPQPPPPSNRTATARPAPARPPARPPGAHLPPPPARRTSPSRR